MRGTDSVTRKIIGSAMRIHTALGPGLFESVYEMVLARDLGRAGLHVERQKSIGFEYDGMKFDDAFRADLIVERAVVVEVKSVASLAPVHAQQLLTYLRLLKLPTGLILNFNTEHLRDGIKRILNDPP